MEALRRAAPCRSHGSFVDALSRKTKERLSAEGMLLSVPAGELLTAKGLTQRELFVIADGVFEVVEETGACGSSARRRDRRDGVLLDRRSRTASVSAVSDGRVVVLRRADVDRMRQTDPVCAAELLFELARVQADRADTSL